MSESDPRRASDIGQLNESPLHSALKEWYASPADSVEVAVDGYVIDIVREGLLIEIQTGNFASIKGKLGRLLRTHAVRLVFPVALEKWITKLPVSDAGDGTRRRSPKRGQVEDVFAELVSLPELLVHPDFSLEVLMIRMEEIRKYVGKRKWRTGGWAVDERRLVDVVERVLFVEPNDWLSLVPDDLKASFTAKQLAEARGIRPGLGQKMAYCLRRAGIVSIQGKSGRANLYSV